MRYVLGPVNTNPISSAGAVFCPARQNERGLAVLNEQMITPLGGKQPQPFGLRPEGSALGVRPEGSALGVRPEGSALGVRPEGSALGVRPEGSALGVRRKTRHSALLVAHLESPNLSPRALIGVFSGATEPIGLVLTGPNLFSRRHSSRPASVKIASKFTQKYFSGALHGIVSLRWLSAD